MISFEEAIEAVLKRARKLPAVRVRLEEAAGRILAADVRSPLDMPPFDKALVDGYALRSRDVRAGIRLKKAGTIQAGGRARSLPAGACLKIMTGAPVPRGADAVVMVERTREAGGFVRFSSAVKKDAGISRRGSDMKRGQLILRRGSVVRTSHIAALAAAGKGFLRCGRLPSVSVVNTGGEIVQPGGKLPGGSIYNSNGPMLAALLREDGMKAEPVIVRDEPARLRAALSRALKADIVLVSGGVSMGDYDLVPGTLKSLGVKEVFHKVRVRPGKPMFFGVKGRKLVFGIPGNPVANFMAYHAYVRPAILKMAGASSHGPEFTAGRCSAAFRPRTGRLAMELSKVRAAYSLAPARANGSADVLALASADAFTMVRENGELGKDAKGRFLGWR
ncbi:MAG: molybdopterin molybdotransferase MoeA [Elusimicrobia bacterium]|nr:molybdopterin molybdotransferase MoeA [Elusimicrobiota bacterium]